MIRPAILAALACCIGAAQDTRLEKTPAGVVEHLLGPSPTLRKQALDWAKSHVDAVAPLIATALEKTGPKYPPFDAIRSLGELRDPRISTALVGVFKMPEFPWKPHALEALADHAFPPAAGLFAGNLTSPVARTRAAACRGVGAIDMRVVEGLVSARVGDEEAAVRVEAARTLVRMMGDHSGVPLIVRDLSLDRRFTDADPGAVAREAAAVFLKEIGLPPQLIPAAVATKAQMEDVIKALKVTLGAAAEKFPDTMDPHEPDVGPEFRYAVEVRSCTHGDYFVRLSDDGRVVLGRDLLRHFTVDRKVVEPVIAALKALDTGSKPRKILGPVNCDFERLAVREDAGWRTLIMGNGKRDPSYDAFEAAVVNVIRNTRGDDFAKLHAQRVQAFRTPEAAESAASRPAESRPAGSAR